MSQHYSGEPCPCGHYLVVVDTIRTPSGRVQYFGCKKCGRRPADNKRTLPPDAPTPRFRLAGAST